MLAACLALAALAAAEPAVHIGFEDPIGSSMIDAGPRLRAANSATLGAKGPVGNAAWFTPGQSASLSSIRFDRWKGVTVEACGYLTGYVRDNPSTGNHVIVKEWPACERPWNVSVLFVTSDNFADAPPHSLIYALALDGKQTGTHSRSTVPLNKWVHLAGTWDGRRVRVYLDGRLEGEIDARGKITDRASPLRVGLRSNCGRPAEQGWSGGLDEVQVHGRALDGDEILAHARTCDPNLRVARNP